MLKRFGIYSLVLLGILAALPYFSGILVQKKVQQVLDVMSQSQSIAFVPVEYHRGWLRSQATTKVVVHHWPIDSQWDGANPSAFDPSATPITFLVHHDIHHGPIVKKLYRHQQWHFVQALIDSKIERSKTAQRSPGFSQWPIKLICLNRISLNGDVDIQMTSPEVHQPSQEGQPFALHWKGLNGRWRLQENLQQLKGEVLLPGFRVQDDTRVFTFSEVVYTTERSRDKTNVWLGKVMLDMLEGQWVDPQNKVDVHIHNLHAGGVIEKGGDLIDSAGQISMDKLKWAQEAYGPIQYSASVKNIEAAVLGLYQHVQQGMLENQQGLDYFDKLIDSIPILLNPRPKMEIDQLMINTPFGPVQAQLQMAIGGPQAKDIRNPQQIFQSFLVAGHLTIPKTVFHKVLAFHFRMRSKPIVDPQSQTPSPHDVEAQIAAWLEQGYLVVDGENYLIHVDLHQGRLKINDTIIPIPIEILGVPMPPS